MHSMTNYQETLISSR